MWMGMQHGTPEDWVVATGESHSVSELCERAFGKAGLEWRDFVKDDPRYRRPSEIDELRGDSTKARDKLGWRPSLTFPELVSLLVERDLELAAAEAWARTRGR